MINLSSRHGTKIFILAHLMFATALCYGKLNTSNVRPLSCQITHRENTETCVIKKFLESTTAGKNCRSLQVCAGVLTLQ